MRTRSHRSPRVPLWAAYFVLWLGAPFAARAQSHQFWPELSTYIRVNQNTRFYFIATTVKENRESTEGEVGPNIDFLVRPLWNQHRWGAFRLDESKNRVLTIRAGYRYIYQYTGDASGEHRGVVEATARYPLLIGLLVSDRNRMDLRSIAGDWSWRYRNRLTVERDLSIGRFKFDPYARGEIYYDSRYHKVSRTALTAGSVFQINSHLELESYFEHQNDSGGSSNRTVYAVGAVVNLYF